jgi:hypothetical protein
VQRDASIIDCGLKKTVFPSIIVLNPLNNRIARTAVNTKNARTRTRKDTIENTGVAGVTTEYLP